MDDPSDSDVATRARDVLAEVEPDALRERAEQQFDDSDGFPSKLALKVADETGAEHDVVGRVVACQFVYAGLTATEELADNPPWETAESRDERDDANIGVLAAEVLVGKGTGLLAGTPGAPPAIEAIRTFAAVKTEQEATERYHAAVCRLAVAAGCAGGYRPAADCGETALDLLDDSGADEIDVDGLVRPTTDAQD